jgi:IS5 family transposase
LEEILLLSTSDFRGDYRRNPLKGALGDALHAVLCGAGHNIRLLLKKLRLLFTFIVWAITGDRAVNHRAHQLAVG